jgi:hypothetical protein
MRRRKPPNVRDELQFQPYQFAHVGNERFFSDIYRDEIAAR